MSQIWTRTGARARRFERNAIDSCISGVTFLRFGTVRTRVQIPGPRPISVLKIGDFVVQRCRGTAGAQFRWELPDTRGAMVTVVGGSEFASQQSMAPHR